MTPEQKNIAALKKKARSEINWRIAAGHLIRPLTCPSCGKRRPVEAHHFNGYDEANWLNIKWLCKECHYGEHGYTYGQAATKSIKLDTVLYCQVKALAKAQGCTARWLVEKILTERLEIEMLKDEENERQPRTNRKNHPARTGGSHA